MHVHGEIALGMKQQIISYCMSVRDMISSKSSETLFDADNRQSGLIDKMMNSRSERIYHVDDAIKEGMLNGLFGKKDSG